MTANLRRVCGAQQGASALLGLAGFEEAACAHVRNSGEHVGLADRRPQHKLDHHGVHCSRIVHQQYRHDHRPLVLVGPMAHAAPPLGVQRRGARAITR